MRQITGVLFLIFVFTFPARAQDTPKAEVFGGYSYFRDQGFTLSFFGPPTPRNRNFHGWNTSVAGNINRWFGVAADFSGHYGEGVTGTPVNFHSFTFGPQFSYRGSNKVTPFARILFGGVRGSRTVPNTQIAGYIGGGIDWNASERIAVRIVQLDGLLSFPEAGTRLSFGVVFRLGRK